MSDSSPLGSVPSLVISPLTTQADKVLHHPVDAAARDREIEKSGKDFEAILLSSWLQQAEESFGTLPGGEDDEDADPAKEQFQGLAMQSLGSAMTAAGGIGIAKMITTQLHKAADLEAIHAVKLADGGK